MFFMIFHSNRYLLFWISPRETKWEYWLGAFFLCRLWSWVFMRGKGPFCSGRLLAWGSSMRWGRIRSFVGSRWDRLWVRWWVCIFYRSQKCRQILCLIFGQYFSQSYRWRDCDDSWWHLWVWWWLFLYQIWSCRHVWVWVNLRL